MAAGARGVHAFSRRACRIFDFKTNGNLLKSSPQTGQLLSSSFRQNGTCVAVSLSPRTRQLLNSINKNTKWSKTVFDSIKRSSSSAIITILSAGNSPLTLAVCCSSDELSADGDEDSTNRKKRIYLFELLNDDP